MNNSIQEWAASGRTQLLFVQRAGSTLPPGGIVATASVPGAPLVAVPWLGSRADDMSTPTGFAAASGTPFVGGAFGAQVVASPPTLAAITALAQSATNPFNLVNHSGYTATAADQAALCLVRSLTRTSDVLADVEYVAFENAMQQPTASAAAGTFVTFGAALFAQGGTKGSMKPSGTILTGPFTPGTSFKPNDPVLGTVQQEQFRYVGASPVAAGTGVAGANVGERTNMQAAADIVNDSRNVLKTAPSAKAAVLADIALNTGGVAWYDLNNVMFGSQYASDWLTALHTTLFPPVTVPVQPPATPPVTPPAGPITSVNLLAGRFTVSCSFTGPNVTGAGVAVQETDDAAHFLFPVAYSDSLHPQVEVSMYDEVASSGNFWVFIAAETTVPFAVTVTEVATKQVKTYTASGRDTAAF